MGKFEDDIQNLLDDSKVVTYRNLSSLLDVHVNISKKMLYTFYQQNQDKLCAVYLICGKTKSGSTKVILVSEKDKTSEESFFEKVISEHLFAIGKVSEKGIDTVDLYKADLELRKSSGFNISLRSIKSENCEIKRKQKEVKIIEKKPEKFSENVTEKPLDSKPTQEQKQQIKSCTKTNKGKSKPNNAISAMFAKAPPPKKKNDTEEKKPVKKKETIKDNSPGKENKHDPPNVENTKDEVKKKRDNSQEKTSNAKRRKRIQVM